MGREIDEAFYTRGQFTQYRRDLRRNLDIFETYLDTAHFDDEGTVGVELELNMFQDDDVAAPAMVASEVLATLAEDPQAGDFTHEIGAFNIEANLPITHPQGVGLRQLEEQLEAHLAAARAATAQHGAQVIPIGHLPTAPDNLFDDDTWRAPGARFEALENAVLASRGEQIHLSIAGEGRGLDRHVDTIGAEALCTSMQLHLQVPPEQFALAWNAAQAIAGPQLALAANSPFVMGKRLWHESRIPVFTQALDSRPPEYAQQGVRPRVWFGERWITSMFDLFEENVRWFPPLIPETRQMAEEPLLTDGQAPLLHELMLHNGTVWRWNRPIYDPGTTSPHLRLENRLLPAGPTPMDMAANAAFFYGMMRKLIHERRPLWSRMEFSTASENFWRCAQWGMEARVIWPKRSRIRVADLLEKELIPIAVEGLAELGADQDVIDRYAEVLVARAKSGRNGARWQMDAVTAFERAGQSRTQALVSMTREYARNVESGEPVHRWAIPTSEVRSSSSSQ